VSRGKAGEGLAGMAYHPLANDTGGDAFARNREASKIIIELKLFDVVSKMHANERDFVLSSRARLEQYGIKAMFSPKQVFWLRDLRDLYL
jgi:hypothetical protein